MGPDHRDLALGTSWPWLPLVGMGKISWSTLPLLGPWQGYRVKLNQLLSFSLAFLRDIPGLIFQISFLNAFDRLIYSLKTDKRINLPTVGFELRTLMLELTTLPTAPQPVPSTSFFYPIYPSWRCSTYLGMEKPGCCGPIRCFWSSTANISQKCVQLLLNSIFVLRSYLSFSRLYPAVECQ